MDLEKEKLWKSILEELEISISPTYFNTFFQATKVAAFDEEHNKLLISCPSQASKNILETRFKDFINTLVTEKTGKNYTIVYQAEEILDHKKETNKPLFQNLNTISREQLATQEKNEIKPKPEEKLGIGLVKEYTFENFIIGPNNRLAYTVAQAIAENPGIAYNPFLIYSNVGLGKTHLLQAIGNEVVKKGKKVLYCTGQDFMNELMDALQKRRSGGGTIMEFKRKFTSVDVWLIDDVQVIAGRDSTQEEFYFAFNHLYLNKKQIVLSSDRHPSEIAKLQDRISSRFNMGMIADIQMPDVDIRNAILRNKRDQLKINIDNDTIDYIAQNINTNVRELEGAFLQVITYARTMGQEANIDAAKFVLGNSLIKQEEKNIRPTKVIQEIAKFYNIEIREIKGKRRTKDVVIPRQICMYLLKEINQLTYINIGEILGNRDHTTIMHGAEKIKKEVEEGNFRLRKELSTLKEIIINK